MSDTDTKKSKKSVTLSQHIAKYNEIIKYLDSEIQDKSLHHEPGIRVLQKVRKQIKHLKKEVPRLRRTEPSDHPRVSGFGLPCHIDEKLRTFLQLEPDATPTRHEIRNALDVYIKFNPNDARENMQKWSYLNPDGDRNLQDPTIRSVIHPDTQLADLLNYRDYVDRVHQGQVKGKRRNPETGLRCEVVITDDSLTYCVVQQLIQCHILKTLPSS